MATLEVISTPREMIEAIAAMPTSQLFNELVSTMVTYRLPHPQHALEVFARHGFQVAEDVAVQLDGGKYIESFIPRPGPVRLKLARDEDVKPAPTPAQASVLFFEAARSAKSQRFEAVVCAGADGIMLPARFYWERRRGDESDLMLGRQVTMHVAKLKASGKSSFTTPFGQLRQR
jgi:hypothetical protein